VGLKRRISAEMLNLRRWFKCKEISWQFWSFSTTVSLHGDTWQRLSCVAGELQCWMCLCVCIHQQELKLRRGEETEYWSPEAVSRSQHLSAAVCRLISNAVFNPLWSPVPRRENGGFKQWSKTSVCLSVAHVRLVRKLSNQSTWNFMTFLLERWKPIIGGSI